MGNPLSSNSCTRACKKQFTVPHVHALILEICVTFAERCFIGCVGYMSTDLVMHEDLHDVQVDLKHPVVLRLVGEQDELDSQQRDEDEGGSNSPHVEAGLGVVRHPQLGDENPDDVEQEEEIHLESKNILHS